MNTKIDYADYQESIELFCRELECMEDFRRLKYVKLSTQYPGEWFYSIANGLEVVTKDGGILNTPISDPEISSEAYDIDVILCQFMLQRIFQDCGIECPYIYPLNLCSLNGLVQDAMELLRMKRRGEDLSGFRFTHCLNDFNRYKWVKEAPAPLVEETPVEPAVIPAPAVTVRRTRRSRKEFQDTVTGI